MARCGRAAGSTPGLRLGSRGSSALLAHGSNHCSSTARIGRSSSRLRSEGSSPYVDDLRPNIIDLPQRFGNSSFHIVDPGQSFVRADYRGAAIGISTEDIFWGPGIRQALLFDANAAGFPHLFVGTSHAIATPVGRFYAQLLYGRLQESRWAPPNGSSSRFGAGGIAVWMPPSQPIEIGVARFYHRRWPKSLSLSDLAVPFGSAVNDREVQGVGVAGESAAFRLRHDPRTRVGLRDLRRVWQERSECRSSRCVG